MRGLAFVALLAAPSSRAAPAVMPKIHSRFEWSREPVGDIPPDPEKTRIVLHHTAAFVSDADKALTGRASWERAIAHARAAQSFHTHIRGWRDIGYHFMIDWEGRILEGRPLGLLGAHVEKRNTGAIGIVLMGDLSRQRPTPRQVESLRALLKWLMRRYEIPPDRISGHYQMKRTTCPGTYLNGIWRDDGGPLDYVQLKAPRANGRR